MKKLIALLLTVLAMAFCLTGCKDKVDTVAYENGVVKSGNGTFAVEKGDYLYFVNGVASNFTDNKMGDVEKGALYRVKLTEMGTKNANVERVIPKLATTGSATNGVFIYGDNVYYASPYDEKDKTGTVRSDYVDFRSFNLKDGNSERISYEKNSVIKYQFLQNGNKVYLAYEYSETVDGAEKKKLKVLDASNGDSVYSVDGYTGLFFADDNQGKIFFAKNAYSEDLEADESFIEIYCYVAGNSSADMVFSGCGKNALGRDNRNSDDYKAKILDYTDLSGATLTIVKNTGKFLIFKLASLDSNSTTCYFGLDLSKEVKKENLVNMGSSNTYIDTALTSTAVVADLNSIYYIENSTYLKGLVKFDYSKVGEVTRGRTLLTGKANGANLAFMDGNFIYVSGTDGIYYRVDVTQGENADYRQINAIASKGLTEWFVPRVVGDKFITVYGDSIFQNYLYAIDLKDFADEDKYGEYISGLATLDREKVTALSETIVGKMTGSDKDAFNASLDATYPEEIDEE